MSGCLMLRSLWRYLTKCIAISYLMKCITISYLMKSITISCLTKCTVVSYVTKCKRYLNNHRGVFTETVPWDLPPSLSNGKSAVQTTNANQPVSLCAINPAQKVPGSVEWDCPRSGTTTRTNSKFQFLRVLPLLEGLQFRVL